MNTVAKRARGCLGNSTLVALLAAALAPGAAAAAPGEPGLTAAQAPPPAYKLALGGGVSVGDPGWGTELGSVSEVSGRVQVLPWLGVGLSYMSLSAPNNEGADAFGFQAVELHGAWHPVTGKWFDPFLRVGALGVFDARGGYMGSETTSRLGLETMAGFDFVRLPFAVGVHARAGFTDHAWTLAGLHAELRI